jgi:hypothetical protein
MEPLTPEQAQKIRDSIGPTFGYLLRLIERTEQKGLRNGEPKLYQLVRRAEDVMHSLSIELHYQSCRHGLGRPPTAGASDAADQ